MIDTILIQLSNKDFDQDKLIYTFHNKLTIQHATEYKNGYQGSSLKATYRNFNFFLTDNNLKAIGSVTKFIAGNNLTNLPYECIRESLTHLENVLDIPLGNAIVSRLDIGFNIFVDQPVQDYLRLLIRPQSYVDFKVGEETVDFRYRQTQRILTFYNKVSEAFKQGKVPDSYKNQHVLRYELRLRTKALRELGFPDLRFADLYDPVVYKQLVGQWYDHYKSVPKVTDPQPKKLAFNSVKGFKDSLAIYAINDMGGTDFVKSQLESSHGKPKAKCDIRKVLARLKITQALSPFLLQELDAKIERIYQLNS